MNDSEIENNARNLKNAIDSDIDNVHVAYKTTWTSSKFFNCLKQFFGDLTSDDEFILVICGITSWTKKHGLVIRCSVDTVSSSGITFQKIWSLIEQNACKRGSIFLDVIDSPSPNVVLDVTANSNLPILTEENNKSDESIFIAYSTNIELDSKGYDLGSLLASLTELISNGVPRMPYEEFVSPIIAVDEINRQWSANPTKSSFSILARASGLSDDLSIAVNVCFDPQSTRRTELKAVLNLPDSSCKGRLMDLGRRITCKPNSLLQRLSSCETPLSQLLKYDPITRTEICLINPESNSFLFYRILMLLPVLVLSVNLVCRLVFDATFVSICMGIFTVLLTLLLFTTLICRWYISWSCKQKEFIIVSPDGLFYRKGFQEFAIGRDEIKAVRNKGASILEIETIDIFCPHCIFDASEGYDLESISQSIEWGKDYVANRWSWKLFNEGEQPQVTVGLIGCTNYDDPIQNELPGEADLNLMESLCDEMGLHDDSVASLLIDGNKQSDTKQMLVDWLGTLMDGSRKEALVLYFSGHAIVAPNGNLQLLLPAAPGGESLHQLIDVADIAQAKCDLEIGDLVVILDCCFAGAAGDALSISFDSPKMFDAIANQSGLSVLASSSRSEESLAHEKSMFTDSLTKAVRQLVSNNGEVRLIELSREVNKSFEGRGMPSPQLFCDQNGANLVLFRSIPEITVPKKLAIAEQVHLRRVLEFIANFCKAKMKVKAKTPSVCVRLEEFDVDIIKAKPCSAVFGYGLVAIMLGVSFWGIICLDYWPILIYGPPIILVWMLERHLRRKRPTFVAICQFGIVQSFVDRTEFITADRIRSLRIDEQYYTDDMFGLFKAYFINLVLDDGRLTLFEKIHPALEGKCKEHWIVKDSWPIPYDELVNLVSECMKKSGLS